MTTDDTPIETSEREARPWKPSDGYLPAGGDPTQPALAAFDSAVSEVGVRNVLLADRLRGAFVRHIAAAQQPPAAQQGEHLLQDQSRGLSQWLASQPDARLHAREAAAAIAIAAQQGEAVDCGHEACDCRSYCKRATQPAAAPQPVAQSDVVADALIDRFESACIQRHITINPGTDIEHRSHDRARDEYDAARAALAAAPAGVVGEPVVYINPRVIDQRTGKVRAGGAITHSDTACAGWTMPLYAAPPARQALTPDQISQMEWGAACIGLAWDVRVSAVRAVENAHGIGGNGGADHG